MMSATTPEPEPLRTVQVWPVGGVAIVTAYLPSRKTNLPKVNAPSPLTVNGSLPLLFRTSCVPAASPVTVPLIEYQGG